MTKRINEAEGRAQEILAIAQATAESITKVGESLVQQGGDEAIKLRLAQAYLKEFGHLANSKTQVLLPADITKIDDLLNSVGLNIDSDMADLAQLQNALPQAQARDKVPVSTDAAQTTPVTSGSAD